MPLDCDKLGDAAAEQLRRRASMPAARAYSSIRASSSAQGPVGFGAGERRGEMIDDDGSGAALGLGAFARVIDDERVKLGQRDRARFGPAFVRERGGLAGQPFEIAVLAVVDDRMGAEHLSQPDVEGEIAMRRHQGGIVIGALRIDVVAARRLDGDRDMPMEANRQPEHALAAERVLLGRTPAGEKGLARRGWGAGRKRTGRWQGGAGHRSARRDWHRCWWGRASARR